MEKYSRLKIKAAVCAGLALGTLTSCNNNSNRVEIGDKGVAKEGVFLVINPLAPHIERKVCEVKEGEGVKKGRDSYVSDGNIGVGVTFIEGEKKCSGWSFGNDYIENFEWNK